VSWLDFERKRILDAPRALPFGNAAAPLGSRLLLALLHKIDVE
jgi:hypothetical protein